MIYGLAVLVCAPVRKLPAIDLTFTNTITTFTITARRLSLT